MSMKLVTLMETKFNISNPHEIIKELNQIGKIDSRSLRKSFEDTPPERFDLEVIKKYVSYVFLYPNKRKVQYEPEYWMYRRNISYDEAVELIKQNKIDNGQTKEAFIKRHGEERGLEMYEKFRLTSAYSSSDEWFKEKYGETWEEEKAYAMKRKSKRTVEYWTYRGYSLEDAKIEVSKYQRSTSGVHREYYRQKGYSEDEISVILSKIDKKKLNHKRNTNYLREKYPDTWQEIYLEVSEKYRKRMEELGVWIENDIVDDFKKYKTLVIRYTNQSLLFYGETIENLELRSREFQLDHKYSIKMGFINNIPAEIIGSIVNLEMLPGSINGSKQHKCSITKTHLLTEYKKFKETHESKNDSI